MCHVQTVMKPVKPSDLMKAVNTLMSRWRDDDYGVGTRDDVEELQKLRAAVESAKVGSSASCVVLDESSTAL